MSDPRFAAASLNARLITGAALGVILIGVWLAGGVAVLVLGAVVAALAQWEFYNLFLPGKNRIIGKAAGIAMGFCYMAASYFLAIPFPVAGACAALLLCALYSLIGFTQEKALDNMKAAAVLACGFFYVPFLITPLTAFSPLQQMLVVLVPVLSDIAAYFAGVRFGKHKIWVAVSPKKSVEGALGGLLAAVTVTLALGLFFDGKTSLGALLAIGAALGVMAQAGDFFESALKRAAGVKDSSNLLPGHGGMLDRIDSLLFTTGAFIFMTCFFTAFAAGSL